MTAENGYYAVVQYRPDGAKLEAANVGVILLSPEHAFLEAKLADDNSRIRRLFGQQNWGFVADQKKSVIERLHIDATHLLDVRAFREYAVKRSNQIRISEPR